MKREKIKVLMYHRVLKERPKKESNWHFVCADDFRRHMKILDSLNFTPVTFFDYQLYLDKKLTLPRKPIILTFDDGYLDTFEVVIPVLLEFGMRAVIFVMGNRSLETATWDESKGGERCPLMTDEQILKARSYGFEIGSHCMNHRELAGLNEKSIKNEIYSSKSSLESLLGEKVQSLSYPYGSVNEKVLAIAAEAGYSFGCGVYTGPPAFGDNLLDFRRLGIDDRVGPIQFLLRLITPYQYVEWAYNRTFGTSRVKSKVSDNYSPVALSPKEP